MATLEQIARSGRTTQSTLAVSGGAQVQAAAVSPASALAGDLMGIMKQGARTATESRTLSVNAAKRVGSQNLTDMAKDLEAIKSNRTPDMDPRDEQKANQAVYQHYGNIKFDNADAQDAFDTVYHQQGSLAVAKMHTGLEQRANLIDHNSLVTSTEEGMSTQLDAGIEQSAEMVDGYVESITAGGFESTDQAYSRLSTILNVNLNKYHEVNRNLQIYIDGKVDPALQTQEFNKFYGSMATIDDEGNVKKVGNTSDEATQSIINNWKALKNRDAARSSSYNLLYQQNMADGRKSKSNNEGTYVASVDIKENRKNLNDRLNKINTDQPLTEAEAGAAIILMQEMDNQAEESEYLEQDILTGDTDALRKYIVDGREVDNFVSFLTGAEKKFTITASKYKSAVNRVLENQSSALLGMDISPQNQNEFSSRMRTLTKMEQISGKKSAFSDKYDNVYAPGVSPVPMGRKELQQALAYREYRALTNPAFQQQAGLAAQLQAVAAKTKDGKPLTDLEIGMQSESILTVDKNTNAAAVGSKEISTLVDETLLNVADGTGAYSRMFNADVANGTSNAVKQYIVSNGKNVVAESFVQDLQYTDYGTAVPTMIGGTMDQRIVIPLGVEQKTFDDAISATIKGYNNKHSTNFGDSAFESGVVFRSVYDKGTNNFVTEIYSRDDANELIGSLDVNNIDVTATK
mgnify:CR=1 FL=1